MRNILTNLYMHISTQTGTIIDVAAVTAIKVYFYFPVNLVAAQ